MRFILDTTFKMASDRVSFVLQVLISLHVVSFGACMSIMSSTSSDSTSSSTTSQTDTPTTRYSTNVDFLSSSTTIPTGHRDSTNDDFLTSSTTFPNGHRDSTNEDFLNSSATSTVDLSDSTIDDFLSASPTYIVDPTLRSSTASEYSSSSSSSSSSSTSSTQSITSKTLPWYLRLRFGQKSSTTADEPSTSATLPWYLRIRLGQKSSTTSGVPSSSRDLSSYPNILGQNFTKTSILNAQENSTKLMLTKSIVKLISANKRPEDLLNMVDILMNYIGGCRVEGRLYTPGSSIKDTECMSLVCLESGSLGLALKGECLQRIASQSMSDTRPNIMTLLKLPPGVKSVIGNGQ